MAAPDFNPWVTSSSRFLDPVCIFERFNPGGPASFFRINWRQPLGDGAMLTDAHFAALLRVGRELIYMPMMTPPAGRRRHRLSSAVSVARHLFAFFRWLKASGYTNLSDVDPETVARFRQWLLARRTRSGRPLAPNTLVGYFIVLLDWHRFRDRL